jgi:hypothetical protein
MVEYPHMILARLYAHIEPMDRGERYEDPLETALGAAGVGTVTGGGSQLNEVGGIEFADIEIELANLDGAVQIVIDSLERSGAPQGSEILSGADTLREFGTRQCLAIFLDGVSLPDDVYANLDFDETVEKIGGAAGPDSYRGFWQGPEETGIFFYGSNADTMFERVEPVLLAMPIGQNARVVIRHGKDSMQPRTVRMPRRSA